MGSYFSGGDMPNIVKVLISKINGQNLERQQEIDLSAENVTFDPGTSPLTSTNSNAAIQEAANSAPAIETLTEAEFYFEETEESTTANNYVTAFQQETTAKEGGDYLIVHSAAIKQSSNNRPMDYRVQYRINASGGWTDFIEIPHEGRGDAYVLQTGLNQVTLSSNQTLELRFQYGGTTGGGTAFIKNKGFFLFKIKETA